MPKNILLCSGFIFFCTLYKKALHNQRIQLKNKTMENFTTSSFLLFLIFGATFVNAQAPALQWQKTFGGTYNEFAKSIQPTTDGGYILAGSTESFDGDVHGNHGNKDFWVVKLTRNGNIQWQKALGGYGYETAFSIQQTNDGGCIVAGQASTNDGDVTGNHGYLDFWVVKLDANGNLQWEKSFGGSSADFATSIHQTADGGYIVGGVTNSNDMQVSGNHGFSDEWVIKLNAAGKIQWKKTYGGSAGDNLSCIIQTKDGGYITAGGTNSNNGDVSGTHDIVYGDFWITKLDKNGNLQWQKTFGGSDYESANSIVQTSDGGYIAVGWNRSKNGDIKGNHGDYDLWVIKLNSNGTLKWQRSLGGRNGDFGYSIQETEGNGYIIAGGSDSNNGDVSGNHGREDFWIVKLDVSGNLQWQKSLGGSEYEEVRGIIQTKDGGYIAAGHTFSNDKNVSGNHGQNDFWVIKLSSDASISKPENVQVPISNAISFTLSPNPVSALLDLNIVSKKEKLLLSITNSNGTVMVAKTLFINKGTCHHQLDISKFPPGYCYIHLQSGNELASGKFLKD
jgi:hypothetical protein